MPDQLTFDLPVRAALGREAFFVSPSNEAALTALETWEEWPGHGHLLIGPQGAGKTHLSHVWAQLTGAKIIPAQSLQTDVVPELVSIGALAIEDVDKECPEDAVFHLLNLARAEGTSVLFTASSPVKSWGLSLPDLASRMSALPVSRLGAPDDTLLAALLVKLFEDRQIAVPPTVVDYLVPRIERSYAAALDIVTRLDAAGLSSGQAISRRLAATMLADPAPKGTHSTTAEETIPSSP